MTSKTAVRKWADQPFKLIETPVFAQQDSFGGKPRSTFVEAASSMAVVHNMLIRGLNSIYLQAAQVLPCDHADFVTYALCWHEVIEAHHRVEEESFFPTIEALSGEKGIMEVNVEQHHAFLPGLEAFKTYLQSVASETETFSGGHLKRIIDGFAHMLYEHLTDEIPTLLALERFSEARLPLGSLWQSEGRRTGNLVKKRGGFVFFLLNLDVTFENGLWRDFPPIPVAVKWIMVRVLGGRAGCWRFASCGLDGKPRALYAVAVVGNGRVDGGAEEGIEGKGEPLRV